MNCLCPSTYMALFHHISEEQAPSKALRKAKQPQTEAKRESKEPAGLALLYSITRDEKESQKFSSCSLYCLLLAEFFLALPIKSSQPSQREKQPTSQN